MSNKRKEAETPAIVLTDETARQRWELFHRAIAHAKRSNDAALDELDSGTGEADNSGPVLTVVR